ncbi:hypothetical protein [Streptomyces sp. NPDC088350]|uniref:hypothetical protein n=1 Tax=Streptomyces sp. NPDC088350 TaxID=3365854 RepID=UPI0037F31E54
MRSEIKDWVSAPLGDYLSRIEAGRSPDLPDIPTSPGGWGVLKVSAVHATGYRPSENKVVVDLGSVDPRYEVFPGDLLFSRANTPDLVGSACMATASKERLLLSDKTLRLTVNPTLADSRYVCICLSSHRVRQQIVNAASGSSMSMQNISQGAIERLILWWPPLGEQRSIVEAFDSVDSVISLSDRFLEKELLIEEGLLRYFLEPSPEDAVEDWVDGRFVEFAHLQRGFDITVAEQRQGLVPVVSSSGISSFHDVAKVGGPGVVTGRKGKLGSVYYLESDYWPHDTSLWVNDFKGNDPLFVALYMRAMRLERFDAATSVPTLNRNVVHRVPVTFPRISRQREIVARVECQAAKVSALKDEIAKLRNLKIGLVDDLLTGKVRTMVGRSD